MSVAVTNGLRVEVVSQFIPERSRPAESVYFYAYAVTITNDGSEPVQLLDRHWIIRDAFNHVEEVQGPGVVGHQPRLMPGQSFQYTSFCPLSTALGFMEGSYTMLREDGSRFKARIARFQLVAPQSLN
ncbi:MAG: Co2+/Mg2+ efflux protein ApaG [Spirochaetales bacterium]|nr:Co2+/Mg2+ efflux protein ApaG [Spirochaetales bacterium]